MKAKCLARYITMSVGLDLTTFWNTTWHHYIWWDLGLFRNTFPADPISPTQPQAAYYVLRTLCTLLESAKPATTAVEFTNKDTKFEVDAFRLPDGATLVGVWIPDEPVDQSPSVVTDIRFPDVKFTRAAGIDSLNGTERELKISDGCLAGMIVKDYPIFVRLTGA